VWPLRCGRSQDLASARARRIVLGSQPGRQGYALVPDSVSQAGTRLRLPAAISRDRARTTWAGYRYAASGSDYLLTTGCSTPEGQAVVLLEDVHPDLVVEHTA